MRRFLLITTVALMAASAANAQALLADANKDGKVTKTEYQDNRRAFLLRADKDKDGKISSAEWAKGAERVRSEVREQGIDGWSGIGKAGLFATLDTNKDGYVTTAEIDAGTGPRFEKYDLNHDGVVTRTEANKLEKMAAAQR
jgi:Ca2+-binding EF-hand superfamily protein